MIIKHGLNIILLICLPFTANAVGYYKSVDKNGHVQYTQSKPLGIKTDFIKTNIYPPQNNSTYKRPALRNLDKKKPPADKTEQAEPGLTKAQRMQACKSARTSLATLLSRGQIRQRNVKGETSYLSDKQKQARIKKTRDLINKQCK